MSPHELPALPRDEEGPTFRQPWEAHAFALAVRLAETGCFEWVEWVRALNGEIEAARRRGDTDLGETYYEHWLRALEHLCAEKGLATPQEVKTRQEQWRQAYLHTPHGQPVMLLTVSLQE